MTPIVRCQGVGKSFGRARALDGADLAVPAGTVHALVGQNGAGKTTLMRILTGELRPDAGEVSVRGSVALVRQGLSIVPELTALENIIFGAEPTRFGRIDRRAARAAVGDLVDRTGLSVPLDREAAALPMGLQQRVEILRALFRGAEVLLLDEPTAYLNPSEVDGLFSLLRNLTGTGYTAVFISHKLREVVEGCDAVTVLRRGRTVAEFSGHLDPAELALAMLGDAPETAPSGPRDHRGDAQLLETCLTHERPLVVRAGAVVGIAGVAGNGQDELVAHLAGLRHSPAYGTVRLAGADASRWPVARRRARGLRVVPADVRTAGSAPAASLLDNVLTSEPPEQFTGPFGWLRRAAAGEWAGRLLAAAGIEHRGLDQPASQLSGGNLQRLAIARELSGPPQVLVAHEPTRGVDVRAAAQIRSRLVRFASDGGGVLVLSSDLDELLEICSEIEVIYRGRLVGGLERTEASLAALGELMGGVRGERARAESGRREPVRSEPVRSEPVRSAP